jgi:tetratricopeptide (TPR) repeat protein
MSSATQIQQLLNRATALYHSGDYKQAIQVWQEILAQEPRNQRAMEGIRMASLLLEEAQTAAGAEVAEESTAHESPEVIAKVREGIQKVRSFLASARYMDAMEVCHALLQLAPRSEAVREVLEDARDAYEAQPFIDEHLEIARQLFVQERLDEAMAEIQKIFFLSANHDEAKKLEAKIEALRQKQAPSGPPPAPKSPGSMRMIEMPADSDEAPPLVETAPQAISEPEPPASATQSGSGPILNADWESELAQLNLGPSADVPEPPVEAEGAADSFALTDLSEPIVARETAAASEPVVPEAEVSLPEFDLLELSTEPPRRPGQRPRAEGSERPLERGRAPARMPAVQRGSGFPLGKVVVGMFMLGTLAAGGWWMLGQRSAGASGQNGGPEPPPPHRAPAGRRSVSPGSTDPANVGLSSNTSRPANAAPAPVSDSTQPGNGAPALPPPSPEEVHRQVGVLFTTGRAQMQRGAYAEASATFAKILDLDPANIEAKEQLDQAASKVQEQKKLEEDLQSGKQFFVEKDYESALRKFYRLPKDRNLGEVDLFIRNAWFNWAVMSLKGGNCVEALQRLEEALTLHPEDQEAAKLREVADHYRDRPKDKVFYAFVDRLTYRTLNQK